MWEKRCDVLDLNFLLNVATDFCGAVPHGSRSSVCVGDAWKFHLSGMSAQFQSSVLLVEKSSIVTGCCSSVLVDDVKNKQPLAGGSGALWLPSVEKALAKRSPLVALVPPEVYTTGVGSNLQPRDYESRAPPNELVSILPRNGVNL